MIDDEERVAVGFLVLEVTDKETYQIFYSIEDLKWGICKWQRNESPVFKPPPKNRDIDEGLQKGIISKKEAAILRDTDWDGIVNELNEQSPDAVQDFQFGDKRDEAMKLYMKLMSELNNIQKVVQLPFNNNN